MQIPVQSQAEEILPGPKEQVEIIKGGLVIHCDNRRYLIRGIDSSNHQRLKVNIKAIAGSKFHIDTVDLYIAKQRKSFAAECSELFNLEAGQIEHDLNIILERIEDYLDGQDEPAVKQRQISEAEKEEALKFLKSPEITDIILNDYETIGCCGEKTNKLIGYLAAVSRKLDDPLSLLILSRSAAGKSTLQDSILEFVPDEDKSKYTRITGQALFYKAEDSLAHKLIAIEEDEGAAAAAYSIRAMQSSKFLTIATTIKDPISGQMKTQEYQVKGPLSIILTTTRTDIDYETSSRFIVLTIDETRQQTQAIHKIQRQADTLNGLLRDTKKESVLRRHHNAQRLLRPLKIVNPYAHFLTFADDRLRLRRDHKKYLNLIKAVAFLYQYQRQVKQFIQADYTIDYIEVTLEDIILANAIADEVFGRSLDELAPASRELLFLISGMVKKMAQAQGLNETKLRFSRRDIREYSKWSDWQIREHLRQLVDLEYINVASGSNGSRLFYELLYDGRGEDGKRFFMGLADIKTLRQGLAQANPVDKNNHLEPSLSIA